MENFWATLYLMFRLRMTRFESGRDVWLEKAGMTMMSGDVYKHVHEYKRLFQCGSQEAGLVKYDKYTCKK